MATETLSGEPQASLPERPPSAMQESRILTQISGPLIAAYLAEMGMMITDMIIVGRLGSIELAAVGLAGDWFYVLLLIGMGVVSIVAVQVAQARGAGDDAAIAVAVRQGFLASVVLALPIMLLAFYLAPMLAIAGQDPAVVESVDEYMRPLTPSVLPVLWFTVLRNFITALERPFSVFVIAIVALFANVGINYVLVFGHLGMPAMGVAGAGLGTTIVSTLMLVAIVGQIIVKMPFRAHRVFSQLRVIDRTVIGEIFYLGLPVAGAQVLTGGMFTVAAVLVGIIGAVELAAQQILYTVIYCGLSVAAGIGDAVRVRVAFGIGRASPAVARQAANICFIAGGMALVAVSAALWLAPEAIVRIFLDTRESANRTVLSIAVGLAFVAGVFHLFCGLQIVAANALRGLKDTRAPMWYAAFGYWVVGLGSALVLGFVLNFGVPGIWWGLSLGVAASSVLLTTRFVRRITHETERLAYGMSAVTTHNMK